MALRDSRGHEGRTDRRVEESAGLDAAFWEVNLGDGVTIGLCSKARRVAV